MFLVPAPPAISSDDAISSILAASSGGTVAFVAGAPEPVLGMAASRDDAVTILSPAWAGPLAPTAAPTTPVTNPAAVRKQSRLVDRDDVVVWNGSFGC